ncbi:MAG: ABC transporter ATP-binding protein, partial [Firmicutes bacterium]|nr:ABC transporter ATP-binding protein [Bacillota bacterium]
MAKNDYKLGEAKIRQGGGRMRVNEKPRDFKKTIKQLLSYLRVFLPQYAIAFTCAMVSVLLQLFGPDNMRKITNLIEDGMANMHMDMPAIIRISIMVMCFYLGSSLISLIQSLVLTNATQNTMRYMRNEISKKLNRIPLKRFDTSSFGDLLSRVTNDVDTVGMSLNHAASEIVSSLTTFVGCLIMMLITNVTLSGIAIVCSLSGFFMMKIVISRSQKYFTRRQTYLGLINGHIEEMYAGHIIVKAYNGEAQSIEEFEILNRHLYENNWKSQFISGIMRPIMEFLSNAGYVAICVLGAIMVRNGTIRFGTVIAFILYVKMFTQPLGQIAQAATSIQSATAAAERIFSFLAEEEMEDESAKPSLLNDVDGLVNFEHVHFGYLPDRPVIHDFSVEI